jgi:hypothetical protein
MESTGQNSNSIFQPEQSFKTSVSSEGLLTNVPIKTISGLLLVGLWVAISYSYGTVLWEETITATAIIGGLLIFRGLDSSAIKRV